MANTFLTGFRGLATHLEVQDTEGDWRSACGANTQRTSSHLSNVDCKKCLRWFAKVRAVLRSPAAPQSGTPGDGSNG
jgi:hypothetical protein